jgi:LysR family glycine cleavage system transcriptional activator
MRKLPPLAALRAFEAAARHSSFKRAASELAVTPTAISHQIRLLEATLGLQLFVRGTRRVDLTPAGARLFPALRDGFDGFEQAIRELGKPRREVLTLSATPLFTARWLVPRVDGFRAANPGVDLRLHATSEVVDLLGGEADAAIRYGRGPFPGLFSEPLIAQDFVPMCSPTLGLTAQEQMRDAPLLHNEWRHQGPDTPTWARWGRVAGIDGVDWTRGVTFTDEAHVIQAAIAGQGVALLSPLLLSAELEQGSLVHPFGPALPGVHFHFVRPDDPRHAARSAALESWLRAALA